MQLQAMGAAAGEAVASSDAIVPVILCGGSGTRLWPLSNSLRPKQFLPLINAETMLETTLGRTRHRMFSAPVIVTREDLRSLVREQAVACGASDAAIIVEPVARSTAPAIALAAHWARQARPDALMLVMPSDHSIADERAFFAAVETAVPAALAGRLVTFGIAPERAESGFGYIQAGTEAGAGVRHVTGFVEKPGRAMAQAFCASGSHFWNAGIFLFSATALLDELALLAPDVASACAAAMAGATTDSGFVRPAETELAASPAISIDHAVMERTARACVVPVSMGWSDVGSWDRLWEISSKDGRGNVLGGDVTVIDCDGSLVRSESGLTVAAIGVEDLVVVATRDAVLIVPRARSQDARLVVAALKAAARDGYEARSKVHPPCGCSNERFSKVA